MTFFAVGTALGMALVAGWASPDSNVTGRAGGSPACAGALASLAAPTPPAAPPPDQPYDPLRGFDPAVDLGIGHLRVVDRFEADWMTALTLPMFARPQVPQTAWLVNGWVMPAVGPPHPMGFSGLVETGYELPSFIVFEARDDGWVRIRFAPGPTGVAWTHTCFFEQASVPLALERWDTRLLSAEISPLFFRAAVRHALRRDPTESAERLRWISAAAGRDVVRPIEVRGDWMRVELRQPSDYCADPDDPPSDAVEGWIRWRDESGRPWLWYYTRGC